MQLSNREGADDPLGRFRSGWRLKARHTKDTWTPGTEAIETAMEETFHDGIKFAAEFLESARDEAIAAALQRDTRLREYRAACLARGDETLGLPPPDPELLVEVLDKPE